MNKLLFGRSILLVEDEMLIMMMIEGMLADLGCNLVRTAASTETALHLIGEERFDLAMLDMNLDSHLVADALDAQGVRFLFCTGNSSGDGRPGAQRHPLLRKPFSSQHLTDALALLIAKEDALPLAS